MEYKIVAEEVPTKRDSTWDCDGCIFYYREYHQDHLDDECLEPKELECYKNIWILEVISEDETV